MSFPAAPDALPIETDYLVIGGGATALAFVDTLLSVSDATVTIVDRRDHVGGHWNDAYSFVRLHQPNAWYGVPSHPLPDDDDDPYGRGAKGNVVLDYFQRVLADRLLPSGRVRWMPATVYTRGVDGTHELTSVRTGERRTARVGRRVVDATLTRSEIPATRPPRYAIAPGIHVVPPNALPSLDLGAPRYTIVGAGKTGMDAALWLLDAGIDASRVRWIVPRDPWLLNRDTLRGGPAHFAQSLRAVAAQYRALATAPDTTALFEQLERDGVMLRLDAAVTPTKVTGAVIARGEMERLRDITHRVRLGHLVSITAERIVLEHGEADVIEGECFVDCSASAVQTPATGPIFEEDCIRLLMVTWGQPLLSAGLIAVVESAGSDDGERNALCAPVLFPSRPSQWPAMWAANLANAARWREHPTVHAWLRNCRLHPPNILSYGIARDDPEMRGLLREVGTAAGAAAERLAREPTFD